MFVLLASFQGRQHQVLYQAMQSYQTKVLSKASEGILKSILRDGFQAFVRQ